jgi:hypothetical protein
MYAVHIVCVLRRHCLLMLAIFFSIRDDIPTGIKYQNNNRLYVLERLRSPTTRTRIITPLQNTSRG